MESVRLVGIVALVATACGRLSFSPSPDDAAAQGDGVDDTTDADIACGDRFELCDTFDDAIDTSLWNVEGSVTRDTIIKHRGESSLRMTVPAINAGEAVAAYVWHQGPPATTLSSLWMRAWMRISALPAGTNALELIALQQLSAQGDYVFVHAADTRLYHQFDDKNASAGAAPPIDTWFCMVWHVTLATTATGTSDFTSDVIPAMSLTGSITQSSPAIDIIAFGPYYAPTNVVVAQAAFDVWLDDVIVHGSQITCDD